jgi:uncharacterized protein YecE (DUF72 family)
MSAVFRIGASGFSYKEWLGNFYPQKLAGPRMLEYYAGRLPAVEINYTFRSFPKKAMFEGWVAKTPANFRFALKSPQRITHFARLRNVGESLTYFLETAAALGERLGPVLFQLPPDFERDDALLRTFIGEIAGRVRAAFEFRHRSWFAASTLDILREGGAALCIAETETMSSPVERTAGHVYARLRREDYDEASLREWAHRLTTLARDASEVYVFFKHEASAPSLAARLQQLIVEG